MANMLIKIGAALLIFINIYRPMVNAESENLKQCFYIVTEDKKSKDLSEDLKLLSSTKIPTTVIIDPNEKINKRVIDVLVKIQRQTELYVLLKNYDELEKRYFAVRGYGDKLKISGLCNVQKDKLVYIGKSNVVFYSLEMTKDPLKTISEINAAKKFKVNYALVVNDKSFNISTLLLAYNELQGVPLNVSDYSFHLKEPAAVYSMFVHVGDFTIVLFFISIVIFSTAIIIFKKWSREKFID